MINPFFRFNFATEKDRYVYGSSSPRGKDKASLDRYIAFLNEWDIKRICVLLSKSQLDGFQEDILEAYRANFGKENVCWAPIEDFHLVDKNTLNDKIIPFLKESYDKKMPTVVHCMGGIGRTGHILALYLIKVHGFNIVDAVKEVEKNGRDPFEAIRAGMNTVDDFVLLVSDEDNLEEAVSKKKVIRH